MVGMGVPAGVREVGRNAGLGLDQDCTSLSHSYPCGGPSSGILLLQVSSEKVPP